MSANGRGIGVGGTGSTPGHSSDVTAASPGPVDPPLVLLLRAGNGQVGRLGPFLSNLGARVELAAVLKVVDAAGVGEFDSALRSLDTYTWIIFTSANAVRATADRLQGRIADISSTVMPSIVAVGKATAQAAADAGWPVTLQPKSENAAGLLEEMSKERRGLVLLPQSALSDNSVQNGLRKQGYTVTKVIAYGMEPDTLEIARASRLIVDGHASVVLFYSPSTVKVMRNSVGIWPAGVPIVCIGERTAEACRDSSLTVAAVANNPSEESLCEGIRKALASARLDEPLMRHSSPLA